MKAIFWGLFFCVGLIVSQVNAQGLPDDAESGLALPRMVSLRADIVNARSGPGFRYPISWVYRQKNAPVEVVAEFEYWRKIKDWKNAESWIHKNMLKGVRTAKFITPGENNIYAKPDYSSKVIAKAEEEVVGSIVKCPEKENFCLLNFEGTIEGWVPKKDIFGIYQDEVID